MSYVRLFYLVILSLSIILGLCLIKYAYKRRSMPGANYFILIVIASIFYNATYMGEISASTLSNALFWFHLEHLSIAIQQYLWVMMCFEYVRIDKKRMNKLKYIFLYHPVLYNLMYYTNDFHHLYISSYRFESNGYFSVIVTTKGIMYTVSAISASVLVIITTFLYVRSFIKAPRLQRYGSIIMVIASWLPWSTLFSIATNQNYLGIDYYPVITIVSGVFYVYGIFQFHMFNTIPIATEMVFRKSKDGIILLDIQDRIIDANDAAISLYPELGLLSKNNRFSSFADWYPEYQGIVNGNDRVTFFCNRDQTVRNFMAAVTMIMAEDRLEIGKIITVSDITQLYNEQKRLEIMATNAMDKAEINEVSFLQAQIKPHFINNTLSVIASMITRAPEEAKALITDLGEYLANSCYLDSESSMAPLEKEIDAVMTYVNIEKARFRERLQFLVIGEDLPQVYIPKLVLQPLVENAIRHGVLKKAEGGTVQLRMERTEGSICFVIQDDGIGMTQEMADSLTMADKENSGVGIRNIHKRLLKYYGEGLIVNSNLGEGTTVTFTVPYQQEVVKEEAGTND